MPVVINEFEAVSQPAQEGKSEDKTEGVSRKIEVAHLRAALRRTAARHARLRAH